jgi:hypothetical protein
MTRAEFGPRFDFNIDMNIASKFASDSCRQWRTCTEDAKLNQDAYELLLDPLIPAARAAITAHRSSPNSINAA